MGFGNPQKLMKQMQKMQADMARLQDQLGDMTVEATAGGGAVRCVMSCKQEVKELAIEPELLDPEEVEMLRDMPVSYTHLDVYKRQVYEYFRSKEELMAAAIEFEFSELEQKISDSADKEKTLAGKLAAIVCQVIRHQQTQKDIVRVSFQEISGCVYDLHLSLIHIF